MISFNKGVLELSHGDSRARASRSHLVLSWSQARQIAFGSSRLGDKKTSACLVKILFRSCVKVDSVDILKFTQTSFNMFGFWFNRFWISYQKHRYISYMYIGFYLYTICFKFVSISFFCIHMSFEDVFLFKVWFLENTVFV